MMLKRVLGIVAFVAAISAYPSFAMKLNVVPPSTNMEDLRVSGESSSYRKGVVHLSEAVTHWKIAAHDTGFMLCEDGRRFLQLAAGLEKKLGEKAPVNVLPEESWLDGVSGSREKGSKCSAKRRLTESLSRVRETQALLQSAYGSILEESDKVPEAIQPATFLGCASSSHSMIIESHLRDEPEPYAPGTRTDGIYFYEVNALHLAGTAEEFAQDMKVYALNCSSFFKESFLQVKAALDAKEAVLVGELDKISNLGSPCGGAG